MDIKNYMQLIVLITDLIMMMFFAVNAAKAKYDNKVTTFGVMTVIFLFGAVLIVTSI
jgi:hypothetical protein